MAASMVADGIWKKGRARKKKKEGSRFALETEVGARAVPVWRDVGRFSGHSAGSCGRAGEQSGTPNVSAVVIWFIFVSSPFSLLLVCPSVFACSFGFVLYCIVLYCIVLCCRCCSAMCLYVQLYKRLGIKTS